MLTARFQPVIGDLRPAVGVLLAGLVVPVQDSVAAWVGVKPYLSECCPVRNVLVFLWLGCSSNWCKTPVLWDGQQADYLLQEARYCRF